jgi:hypothetical protein
MSLKNLVALMALDTNAVIIHLEPPFLDSRIKDRADIKVSGLQGAKYFYADVTVARTGCTTIMPFAKQRPGLVAQRAENWKLTHTHYPRIARGEGANFYPMAAEDTGALGEGFIKALRALYRERKADPTYQKGPRLTHRATGKKLFGEHTYDSSIENWSFLKYWISRIQILLLRHRIGYKNRTLKSASTIRINNSLRLWDHISSRQEFSRTQASGAHPEPRQINKGKIRLARGRPASTDSVSTVVEYQDGGTGVNKEASGLSRQTLP